MAHFILSLLVFILSLFNGIRLFVDGIVVYLTGNSFPFNDYWWYIVKAFDIPFDITGIVIMIFGFLWLGASVLYFFRKVPGRIIIMFLSLLTLWNILWGAVISLIIFGLNFFVGNTRMLDLWIDFRDKYINRTGKTIQKQPDEDVEKESIEKRSENTERESHEMKKHFLREYDWSSSKKDEDE
jgi:hypothetical protein